MYFIVLGVLLLVMKLAEFGPVAEWSWLVVLSPFGLAVAWWAWADASGLTKRRQMEKIEAKKEQRRIDNLDALGMDAKAARPNRPGVGSDRRGARRQSNLSSTAPELALDAFLANFASTPRV